MRERQCGLHFKQAPRETLQPPPRATGSTGATADPSPCKIKFYWNTTTHIHLRVVYSSRGVVATELYDLQSLMYFLSDPFQEEVSSLW